MTNWFSVPRKAVEEPILAGPVDSNGNIVSSVVPLVTTLHVGQDEVTRLLNCN